MNRRGFLKSLLAALAVPFVPQAPPQTWYTHMVSWSAYSGKLMHAFRDSPGTLMVWYSIADRNLPAAQQIIRRW